MREDCLSNTETTDGFCVFSRPSVSVGGSIMNKHNYLLSLVFFSMMVAVGVVISPILRVEGMCPMAHLINITMAEIGRASCRERV